MPLDLVTPIVIALIPLFILAAGQAMVMIGGGVDLAVPGVMTAATAAGAWVLPATSGSVPAAAAAMLTAGLALGTLQGLGVSLLRLPAWIVSLATLGILAGLSSSALAAPPEGALTRGMAVLAGPLPAWAVLALLVGIAIHLALEKLVCGRWLRALGCHREAARTAGVPVAAMTVGAYALSGFCAGLAAVFLAATVPGEGGPPSAWWLVDILGAVVVGGVRLSGGRGSVGFVFFGALVMVLAGAVLNRAGAPPGLTAAVKTLLVLALLATRPGRTGGPDPG